MRSHYRGHAKRSRSNDILWSFWCPLQQHLWYKHKRFFGALLASLVLHALATFFLPTHRSSLANRESVQILTFLKTTKVDVQRQPSLHREVRPPPSRTARLRVVSVPRQRIPTKPLVSKRRRAIAHRPAPRPRATAVPSPDTVARLATKAAAEPAPTAELSSPLPGASAPAATAKPLPLFSARVANREAPATPAPTSEPAAVALSEGHAPAPGVGIFGESREALLSAKDYLELKKLLRAANQIVIVMDVSEAGKATRIHSISGVNSTLREDVERRLLGASYIPQVCSGLPCDGQAHIVFNPRGRE